MTYLDKDAVLSILHHIPSYILFDHDPDDAEKPEYPLVGLDKVEFGLVDPDLIVHLNSEIEEQTDGDGDPIINEHSFTYETYDLVKEDVWIASELKVEAFISQNQWTKVQKEKNLFTVSAINFAEHEVYPLKFDVDTEQAMNIFVKTNGQYNHAGLYVFRFQDPKTNPNVPTRYRVEDKDNVYVGFDIMMVYDLNAKSARKVQYAITRNSRSKLAPYEMGIVCVGLEEVERTLKALEDNGLFSQQAKRGKKINTFDEDDDD